MLVTYFTGPSANPYVIKGMIDGTYSAVIPQDPKNKNSVTLARSNNENSGAEFTWSVWLYLNDLNVSNIKFQHIFNKGDNKFNSCILGFNKRRMVTSTMDGHCLCVEGISEIIYELNPNFIERINLD